MYIGKIVVEFILPALVVVPIVWWALRKWYLWCFPASVKRHNEINRVSAKYDKALGIGAATEPPPPIERFSQPQSKVMKTKAKTTGRRKS